MSTADTNMRLSSAKNANYSFYVEADWAGDKADWKSAIRYMYDGAMVTWCCRKQIPAVMSSTGVEYIAAPFSRRKL